MIKPLKPLVRPTDAAADVDDDAIMMGPEGVKVIDYISAKYNKHFADAGKAADGGR
jgi:hypothetical protein